jgi:1,4-dihydroxy-2-naphthoate octaprenyltransferase
MIRPAPGWLFLRLSRPFFLLGGFLLFALGTSVAASAGHPFDVVRYLQGQSIVSMLQLAIHYSNEYFDAPGDSLNRQRTAFSGGSGAIGPQGLPRRAALLSAVVCLALAALVAGRMILAGGIASLSWLVLAAISIGAWFYSAPPVRLMSTGVGEIAASLVVAALVPIYAYTLQAGSLDSQLVTALAPLVLLHFAMLLTLEVPDQDSDREAGKRTLVVRWGVPAALQLHAALVVGALVLLGTGVLASRLPLSPAALTVLATAAVAHLWQVRRTAPDAHAWRWVAGANVGLFALTALAEAVGFLVA